MSGQILNLNELEAIEFAQHGCKATLSINHSYRPSIPLGVIVTWPDELPTQIDEAHLAYPADEPLITAGIILLLLRKGAVVHSFHCPDDTRAALGTFKKLRIIERGRNDNRTYDCMLNHAPYRDTPWLHPNAVRVHGTLGTRWPSMLIDSFGIFPPPESLKNIR